MFFSRSIMIKQLLLFSHFEMIKSFKIFIVKLYYYDGALEESADDFLEFFRRQQRRVRRWRFTNRRRRLDKRNYKLSMFKKKKSLSVVGPRDHIKYLKNKEGQWREHIKKSWDRSSFYSKKNEPSPVFVKYNYDKSLSKYENDINFHSHKRN